MLDVDASEGFETLLDDETLMQMAAVGGGFFVTGAAQSVVESKLNMEVPNEVYGIATAYAFYSVDGPYFDQMAMGAGANSLDAMLQRFGIQESVENIV